MSSDAQAFSNPLFSLREEQNTDLSEFSKWTSVLPRYEEQHAEAEACEGSQCPGASWEALLHSLEGKPVRAQIDAVNRFFNRIKFIEDRDNYGRADVWATPYEMFERGGDCEDYAIAKYISLKRLGVSERQMRIMVVQDKNLGGIMHAVLEVKIDGKAYLLDNQVKQVVQAARVFHYRPIYAINSQSWWAFL